MAKYKMVNAWVDAEIADKAAPILRGLGISMSDTIGSLLAHVIQEGGLPVGMTVDTSTNTKVDMGNLEKTVIDNIGVWPGDPGEFPVLGYDAPYGYVCWRNKEFAGRGYICTYAEFLECRDKLENKPKEWPEGVNFILQISSGHWFYIYNAPESEPWIVFSGYIGHAFNWLESLEARPAPAPSSPDDCAA